MSDDRELELRRMAEKRADAKLGFRSHFLAYAIVNAGLICINLLTSRDYFWFVWPMFGWGIGLVAHFAAVYVDDGDSREKAIQVELERLRRRGA